MRREIVQFKDGRTYEVFEDGTALPVSGTHLVGKGRFVRDPITKIWNWVWASSKVVDDQRNDHERNQAFNVAFEKLQRG